MIKLKSYSSRLFFYLFIVFLLFTALVILFQSNREKEFRKSQLENTLDNIAQLTQSFVQEHQLYSANEFRRLDSLMKIIPQKGVRVTIINSDGIVVYDSEVEDIQNMDNHINRHEVKKSLGEGFGANKRKSSSTGNEYYYLARFYNDYFVRTAVLYDTEIIKYLKADRLFLIVMLFLFLLIGFVLVFVIRKSNKTITGLKDYVIKLSSGQEVKDKIVFPND